MSVGTLQKIIGGLSLIVLLALTTSCDGLITVRGRVYVQRQSGAQSRAFVDRMPDDDISGLTPLSGAKIVLYHAQDWDEKSIDPSTIWKTECTSDASGQFDIGDVTAPHKFNAALVVEKPGYKSVTQIFKHEGVNHAAIVILVPDEQMEKNR